MPSIQFPGTQLPQTWLNIGVLAIVLLSWELGKGVFWKISDENPVNFVISSTSLSYLRLLKKEPANAHSIPSHVPNEHNRILKSQIF